MVVESRSVIRNAKNARGLGRDISPAATAPFPKSCASYFRFARFNTFPLYYLRAWHRLLEVDYFDRKISTWAKPFHLRLTEISGNFGIMESTPGLHCRALTGKILVFGLGGGGGGWLSLNKRWSHMEVRLF